MRAWTTYRSSTGVRVAWECESTKVVGAAGARHGVWKSREGDGWEDGKGVTRREYKAEDENEYGYMRGERLDVGEDMVDPAPGEGEERIRQIYKMYDTIEAMKEDKAVLYTEQ